LGSKQTCDLHLTPSHIEEALALVAVGFITVASIVVAFIVVQPYVVG
jgi:hypothetical protein